MKHIVSLKDQSKEDLLEMLDLASELKEKRSRGELVKELENQTLLMLFEKTSTRTRLSFEAGMTELGGHAIFIDSRTTQLSIGTDFIDEIRAIMLYGQILMYRAKKAEHVEIAASLNKIPVIDACSEKYHPAQTMGDLLTMAESKGGVDKIEKVVWLGIENNVSNTLKLACAKLGIHMTISAPEANPASIDKELNKYANDSGFIEYEKDPKKAVKGADFIHTDTWMDMEYFEDGKVLPKFQKEYDARISKFMPYQLNGDLIDIHAPKAHPMHCMACHIDFEITRDAVDHKNSLIFPQAENRMHAQKGMIMWLLNNI